jgi:hypothetical protein
MVIARGGARVHRTQTPAGRAYCRGVLRGEYVAGVTSPVW